MLILDRFLPYRLSLASNAVSELVASAYRARFGLSIPEWRVIAVLAEQPGSTQAEVRGHTAMDKMTVSRAARALMERGLIETAPHPVDGRAQKMSLNPAGHALYAQIAPAAEVLEARLMSEFSVQDQAALDQALRRVEDRARHLAKALPGLSENPDALTITKNDAECE